MICHKTCINKKEIYNVGKDFLFVSSLASIIYKKSNVNHNHGSNIQFDVSDNYSIKITK